MRNKIKTFVSILSLTAMVFALIFTSESATVTVDAAKDNVVIVLDPGHGGTGAPMSTGRNLPVRLTSTTC